MTVKHGDFIYTSAPVDADYSHAQDTGRRILLSNGKELREVKLTGSDFESEYQYNRYGSFMAWTFTAEQLQAEKVLSIVSDNAQ